MPKPLAVVVSDIHIGDPTGVVTTVPSSGYVATGPVFVRRDYMDFVERAAAAKGDSSIDYLVLNGDIWDTAIRPITEIARLSQEFFKAVRLQETFKQIVFIPGNHDHYLWTMTQTQNAVVRPLDKVAGIGAIGSEQVDDFPAAQSGRLVVSGKKATFEIPGVKAPYDGKIFVTGLTGGLLPVNVVYPNLYVLNESKEEAVVITHGHFFQPPWRLLSDVLGKALASEIPAMSLFYLELLNAPLTDFMNHSLAQVGPLSSIVLRAYQQARDGITPPELKPAVEELRRLLDREITFEDDPWLVEKLKEYGSDQMIGLATRLLQRVLQSALRNAKGDTPYPGGRHELGFFDDEENLARIDSYLQLVKRDIPNYSVTGLAFGHTHESIPGKALGLGENGRLRAWNSGSMVCKHGPCDFLPLEITQAGELRAF